MAVCEFDSNDLAGDIETLYASHLEGSKTGIFEPGRSIPPPPEGSFELDPVYQTGIFELVSQWPKTI